MPSTPMPSVPTTPMPGTPVPPYPCALCPVPLCKQLLFRGADDGGGVCVIVYFADVSFYRGRGHEQFLGISAALAMEGAGGFRKAQIASVCLYYLEFSMPHS